jgi:roadblock/LC7 domain-containing protein
LRELSALPGSAGGAVPITAELAAALTKFAVRDWYPFLNTIDTDRSETVALVAEVAEFVERSMAE